MFREHHADMVSLQEKIDTSTPAGRLFYTMIAALSQWEREEIADRVKASIKIRAKLGKSLGGAAPFGYIWKDKRLVLNPAEAPVRKQMYELFAKEKRMKGVARMLNQAGYRTRKGARFTDTTVLRLLEDTTAKGMYRANHTYRDGKGKLIAKPESEWVWTPVEPIVSEELWKHCNDILNARKGGRPIGPKPVQLFAGLLVCGCGAKMYVFARSPKYVCPKCRNKIPIVRIEEIFKDQLEEFFISPDKVRAHLASANTHLADTKERWVAHTQHAEKVKAEMRKVYDLYQSDQISPEGFGKLYKPLEEQERALAAELPRLQGEIDALEMQQLSADEVVAEAVNLHRLWPRFSPEEKRGIVESITEKITVKSDEIDITFWNPPSSEELTKRQRNLSGSWRRPA
jgi:site-specific DNA recombinase